MRLQQHRALRLRERRQTTGVARSVLERVDDGGDELLVAPQRKRAFERVHAAPHVSSVRLDAVLHFAAPALVAADAREGDAVQTQARSFGLRGRAPD